MWRCGAVLGSWLSAPFAWLMFCGSSLAQGTLDITPKVSEAPGAATAPNVRLYAASKALVIGIDNYDAKRFSAGGAWPKLSMAVKDAEEVGKALEAQGFKVTLKRDLSSSELDATFRDFLLAEGSDPEARLFVWFAGHGHTIAGEGYLVPADGPDPRTSDVEFRRKALSLRRFGEYMREARAKHVLAVFDSCFAGTVFNVARAATPPAITYATGLPVRQFVSSGEAEQVVSDDGTFRKLFVDALNGLEPAADANKDGYITGSELGQFLFDKVTNLTNRSQTPRYGKLSAYGYDRGDFVLERRQLQAPVAMQPVTPVQREAAMAWEQVKSSSSAEVLDAFAKQFPGTVYAALARERLAALERAIGVEKQKTDDETRTKAEAARKGELLRKAEEAKAAEESSKAEAARKAEDESVNRHAILTPAWG